MVLLGFQRETEFPNVFRQGLISGTTGDIITFAPVGSSVSFDYSYELDPSGRKMRSMPCMGSEFFFQRGAELGAPGDPPLEYVNTSSVLFTQGGGSLAPLSIILAI